MPKAEIISIMTRRRLLCGSATGAIALPPAITGLMLSRDAYVISLCSAFEALEGQKRALYDCIQDDSERMLLADSFEVRQEPLVYRMAELRAETWAQHQARARALAAFSGELFLEDIDSRMWDKRLKAAILRDLVE